MRFKHDPHHDSLRSINGHDVMEIRLRTAVRTAHGTTVMKSSSPPGHYRYGTPRCPGEGWRIGVTRHPPRGIRKSEWRQRGYFDLWLPQLAPSAALLKAYLDEKLTWAVFARRYRAEMRQPDCQRLIDVLGAFSNTSMFSIGCFCQNESRCHRSLLLPLILQSRASIPSAESPRSFASPPCYLGETGFAD
jgi:uncharacterized protein YeaO (DUF488 family)